MNLDATNPTGRPAPSEVFDRRARIVAKWGAEGYINACIAAGIDVTLVLTSELIGWESDDDRMQIVWSYLKLVPGVRQVQIGNEPDAYGPSSWSMHPVEYRHMVEILAPIIVEAGAEVLSAGFASGNTEFLRAAEPLAVQVICVHPYGRSPQGYTGPGAPFGDMIELLAQYEEFGPVEVTEFGANSLEIGEEAQADYLSRAWQELRRVGIPAHIFCWSDGMVPGFGIKRADGSPKPSYEAIMAVQCVTPDELEFVKYQAMLRDRVLVAILKGDFEGAAAQLKALMGGADNPENATWSPVPFPKA